MAKKEVVYIAAEEGCSAEMTFPAPGQPNAPFAIAFTTITASCLPCGKAHDFELQTDED